MQGTSLLADLAPSAALLCKMFRVQAVEMETLQDK
jgi:hypothetical protein